MKTYKILKLIITSVCFGLIFGLTGNFTCLSATTVNGEVVMGEESQDTRTDSGVLDFIDEDRLVINDYPFPILENTYFLTIEGDVTTRNHFSEGDAVSFVTDPKKTVLIELRMKASATEEQSKTSNTIKNSGTLQFKDGIWTN